MILGWVNRVSSDGVQPKRLHEGNVSGTGSRVGKRVYVLVVARGRTIARKVFCVGGQGDNSLREEGGWRRRTLISYTFDKAVSKPSVKRKRNQGIWYRQFCAIGLVEKFGTLAKRGLGQRCRQLERD
jgi:hypothetical protein